MHKLLIPFVTPILGVAVIMLPAAASAAQCRDSGSGKFAKCGAPGAVPASQYVAKGKPAPKAAHAAAPAPASAKPGFLSSLKPKAKATPAPAARCKSAKGQFVKCGTPGAKPA